MNRPLDLQKKELRKILKEKRNALDPDTCRSSDTAIFKAITSWNSWNTIIFSAFPPVSTTFFTTGNSL